MLTCSLIADTPATIRTIMLPTATVSSHPACSTDFMLDGACRDRHLVLVVSFLFWCIYYNLYLTVNTVSLCGRGFHGLLGFGGGWSFLFIYFLTLKIARELNRPGEGFEEQETTSTLTVTSFTYTHQVTNRCTGVILHLRNMWHTQHEEIQCIT